MGMKSIIALVLPEEDVAYQILALNTEKAHNLKERSLEVIRMYRGLVGARGGDEETDFAAIFEEPHFITFGAAYEKRPRFSAGAYSSIVKRLEAFQDVPLDEGLPMREARADRLLALDDAVAKVVEALKARGFVSPYLKYYVVARVNFLRFKKDGTFDFDETIDKLTASAQEDRPGQGAQGGHRQDGRGAGQRIRGRLARLPAGPPSRTMRACVSPSCSVRSRSPPRRLLVTRRVVRPTSRAASARRARW